MAKTPLRSDLGWPRFGAEAVGERDTTAWQCRSIGGEAYSVREAHGKRALRWRAQLQGGAGPRGGSGQRERSLSVSALRTDPRAHLASAKINAAAELRLCRFPQMLSRTPPCAPLTMRHRRSFAFWGGHEPLVEASNPTRHRAQDVARAAAGSEDQDFPCLALPAAHAGAMAAHPGRRGGSDLFGQRLAAAQSSLSPMARRVVRFIDQNRLATLASSAADLATSIGTSDASVVRAVQALGFEGLSDMRQALVSSLGSRSTPADHMRRTLADVGESTDRAIEMVLETQREALDALQSPAVHTHIAAAVAALHRAERITVFGIGPSAALARYAVVMLGRTGRPASILDATGIGLADQLLGLHAGDAVLVLAYTHPYREVVAVFTEAHRLGIPVVLITDSENSKLARFADVVVPARRGRAERVALHGATLVVLEAVILGLAASNRAAAVATLERLNDLREAVTGKRVDAG